MATQRQRKAARSNIKKAAQAANANAPLLHLPKSTRTALESKPQSRRAKPLVAIVVQTDSNPGRATSPQNDFSGELAMKAVVYHGLETFDSTTSRSLLINTTSTPLCV